MWVSDQCLIADNRRQVLAERGEFVVDPDRDGRGDGAGDQAVAFEPAQGLGEHLLADPGDRAGARCNAGVSPPAR